MTAQGTVSVSDGAKTLSLRLAIQPNTGYEHAFLEQFAASRTTIEMNVALRNGQLVLSKVIKRTAK